MLKRRMMTRILAVTAAMTLIMPMAVFAEGGVEIDAEQEDVTKELGDVSADGEWEDAVYIHSDYGHSADVTTGSLESLEGDSLSVYSWGESSAFTEVNGNVTGGYDGIYVSAHEKSDVQIEANGNVTGACEKAENKCDGICVYAEDRSRVRVGASGDVTGYNRGVCVNLSEGGLAGVTVKGDVTANTEDADSRTSGVEIRTYESTNPGNINKAADGLVIVEGDVAGGDSGIHAYTSGGFNGVGVYGNVSGLGKLENPEGPDDFVNGIIAEAGSGGINGIYVAGDVTGRDLGIAAVTYSGGNNNIVVDGTVYGEQGGICVVTFDENGNPIYGNTQNESAITVWKVETGDDGYLAAKFDDDEQVLKEDTDMLAKIQYIIRVEQPNGGTLTATDSEGNALATVTSADVFEYAHEGDKVLLKIELDKDFGIDAVYGDEGQTLELVKDESGNYYVVVPRGGGVCFSAVLTKKSSGSSGEPDTPANPAPAAGYTPAPAVPGAAVTAEVQAAVSAINDTPAGGTAEITVSDSKIDASIVATLLARRDINVTFTCFINGKLRKITIPAGADIKELIEADGTINVEKLAEKFDK